MNTANKRSVREPEFNKIKAKLEANRKKSLAKGESLKVIAKKIGRSYCTVAKIDRVSSFAEYMELNSSYAKAHQAYVQARREKIAKDEVSNTVARNRAARRPFARFLKALSWGK